MHEKQKENCSNKINNIKNKNEIIWQLQLASVCWWSKMFLRAYKGEAVFKQFLYQYLFW